jgi:hypothetical protein
MTSEVTSRDRLADIRDRLARVPDTVDAFEVPTVFVVHAPSDVKCVVAEVEQLRAALREIADHECEHTEMAGCLRFIAGAALRESARRLGVG